MKGFGIYVKNDLLEPKHISQMEASVWLYLWLLDKMTSINENGEGKILGNTPVTSEMILSELGLPDRTYRRWVARLKKYGYINTLRTPHGLIFTVNKASKAFKSSATNGLPHKPKSPAKYDLSKPEVIGQIVSSDRPNLSESSATLAHVNKDNTKTKQDKTINTTNVVGAEAPFGKPEINELFQYWEAKTGIGIQAKRQANRNACSNLIRTHGVDKVQRLIEGVVLSRSDQYAPRISDFCELQEKLTKLLVWGNARVNKPKGTIKI